MDRHHGISNITDYLDGLLQRGIVLKTNEGVYYFEKQFRNDLLDEIVSLKKSKGNVTGHIILKGCGNTISRYLGNGRIDSIPVEDIQNYTKVVAHIMANEMRWTTYLSQES